MRRHASGRGRRLLVMCAIPVLIFYSTVFYLASKLNVTFDLKLHVRTSHGDRARPALANDVHMANEATKRNKADESECSSEQCTNCSERFSECQNIVKGEMSKTRVVYPRCGTGGTNSACTDCMPNEITVACEHAKQTLPFECTSDLVLLEFDYHTQYKCILDLAVAADDGDTRIPRIGHSVYFHEPGTAMRLHQFLSVLSLIKHQRTNVFFLWNNGLPTGRWWLELLQRVQHPFAARRLGFDDSLANFSVTLYSIRRSIPMTVYGKEIMSKEMARDLIAIEALMQFGGGYLDPGAIALRDLKPLLSAAWVMGYEHEDHPKMAPFLSCSIMFGSRSARFATIWHCQFSKHLGSYIAVPEASKRLPSILADSCPHFIRREARSLHYPTSAEIQMLHNQSYQYNLSELFAIDLRSEEYTGWQRRETNDEDFRQISTNSTIGRIWNSLFFNKPLD